jgi:Fic family protein
MRMPRHPARLPDLIERCAERLTKILPTVTRPDVGGRYLHWDEIRHRDPPEGLNHEEWWLGLKFARTTLQQATPIPDVDGHPFVFSQPAGVQEALHQVTQQASGSMGAADQVTHEDTRDRNLIRNLREEGIASSLIEGAATTREDARRMLRANRAPRSHGEQMVLNNFTAMRYIIGLDRAPLTVETILHLHELLTHNTLEDPAAAGRLRGPCDRIQVVDDTTDEVLHDAPPAHLVPSRLEQLCRFANHEIPDSFVHPVVRAILLHFWLAYDHPFVDGNGRCARALFYWSMMQQDYWLFQFISISRVIYNAPIQYGRAFLHTETDGNDVTYFVIHQLDVIQKALDELHGYLDRKVAERRALERRIRHEAFFNVRQLELIGHALRHPDAQYDIRSHQADHGVVYQTARTDLHDLADRGIFVRRKIGRTWYFSPSPDLDTKLDEL